MPGIVEWPARIAKPFVSETPCSTLDIYPTVLEATGAVAQNQIQPLDGISLLPLFDRKTESRAKAIPFWIHAGNQHGHAALLDWPYKLHMNAVAGRDKKGAGKAARRSRPCCSTTLPKTRRKPPTSPRRSPSAWRK